jgi:hypothetical protein
MEHSWHKVNEGLTADRLPLSAHNYSLFELFRLDLRAGLWVKCLE